MEIGPYLCYDILKYEKGGRRMGQLLLDVFYGLVSGFSQFTPVSQSAHQALFPMLLKYDSYEPLLSLFVHVGALGAVALLCGQRISHLYREMQLVSLPPKRRKRPPDVDAVLDARLIMTAAVPALIGAVLSAFVFWSSVGLLALTLLLIAGGVLIYIPEYLPGGNRKARAMSPMEAFLLGLCAALSVIPGGSAMGWMLALGLLRKCDRSYMLDISILIVSIMLGGTVVVDFLRFLISGFAGFSFQHLLGCLLAAAAAFGGGVGAILTMRFLAVKTGFSSFAFYNWGLGMFSFTLYLML